MLTRIKPFQRRAAVVFGSLWAVAIVFIIARALLPG